MLGSVWFPVKSTLDLHVRRKGEGRAGSVNVWQLCAWHPDNTPCDLLACTHKENKGESEGMKESDRWAQPESRVKEVNSERQKWEKEVDLCSLCPCEQIILCALPSCPLFSCSFHPFFFAALTLNPSHLPDSLFLFFSAPVLFLLLFFYLPPFWWPLLDYEL